MPKDTPLSAEKEIDLFDLYVEDPELADELVFGRVPHKDRRGFLKGAGLATMGALIGAAIRNEDQGQEWDHDPERPSGQRRDAAA